MIYLQALLIALLAIGSQWWFCHLVTRTWLYPIWSGFLTGVILGEPLVGLQAAAYIQLTYLGWITAGGSMPGNLMADPTMATTFAVTLSLVGILINQAYMTINALWVHQADKFLEKGNIKMVRLMNYLPSFLTAAVLYGIPAFLMVVLGASWAESALSAVPQWLIDALNLVGSIMPALGIAMLLNYIGKKKLIAFFFVGYFATVYLGLDTMSLFVFGTCIAVIMYFFGAGKEEA